MVASVSSLGLCVYLTDNSGLRATAQCVCQACIYSAEVPLTSQVSKVIAGQGFCCPQLRELTGLGSGSMVLPAANCEQELRRT